MERNNSDNNNTKNKKQYTYYTRVQLLFLYTYWAYHGNKTGCNCIIDP
jgi:hypothetical protein